MDVFVTGGSGFLGQHLIRMLVEGGHSTIALARSQRAEHAVAAAGATAVRGDLDDVQTLAEGMRGADVVVHAAAHTAQWGPKSYFERVNVDGTRHVVEAAKTAAVPRVVLVSTEAVLADGRPLVRVDETRPRPGRPVGLYARTKGLAEDLVLAANSETLTTVAVRPRFVWGPGDATVLPEIAKAAVTGRFAWVDGGHYLTSTCHVANACHGIILAAQRGRAGQAYFLTDGPPVEMREFLTRYAATADVTLPDRSVPRWLVAGTASAAEAVWGVLRLKGEPPITRTFVALSGQEMTVVDDKAREELGYEPVLARDAALADLRPLP